MDSEQEEFLAFQTQKVQMGKSMTYEKRKTKNKHSKMGVSICGYYAIVEIVSLP